MTDLDHDFFHIVGKHILMFNVWSGGPTFVTTVKMSASDVLWVSRARTFQTKIRRTERYYEKLLLTANLDNSKHRYLTFWVLMYFASIPCTISQVTLQQSLSNPRSAGNETIKDVVKNSLTNIFWRIGNRTQRSRTAHRCIHPNG